MPTGIAGPGGSTSGAAQWDRNRPGTTGAFAWRRAVAFDKNAINQAETLGLLRCDRQRSSRSAFEYALAIPPYPATIRRRPRSSWPRRGYPNGFDAGDYTCDRSYGDRGRSRSRNYLAAVGHPHQASRPMERAAFLSAVEGQEDHRNPQAGAGGTGQCARRVQNYCQRTASTRSGGYPDIDDLVVQQAREL